jgi:hypothetical protein
MNRETNEMPPPVGAGPGSGRYGVRDDQNEEFRNAELDIEHPGLSTGISDEEPSQTVGDRALPDEQEGGGGALDVRRLIRERPVVAIAAALAAGFIVGRILSR